MRGTMSTGAAAAVLLAVGVIAAGCGGSSKSSSSASSSAAGTPASGTSNGGSINVAIVDNPQMKDIAQLTPSLFTAKTGIKVKYTILDEGTLRQVTTRDVAAGGKQFDVAMIGPYEAPQFGNDGTLSGPDAAGQVRRGVSVQRHHPHGAQRALRERQAVRRAVLWRVVVPHVSQGRPQGGGRDDAAASHFGTRSQRSHARSTSRTWPASACAASPVGAILERRLRPC